MLSLCRNIGKLFKNPCFNAFSAINSSLLQKNFHFWSKPIEFSSPALHNHMQGHVNLLQSTTPTLTQVATFKVKGRLKRRCKDCYFVMRQQRLYVLCKTHPRHKQMAMKAKDYKSWILTHATQSKIRSY